MSCGKDNNSPSINITSPLDNSIYSLSEVLTVSFTISDDEELDYTEITLIGPNTDPVTRRIDLSGTTQDISEVFNLIYSMSGSLTLLINGFDKAGNAVSFQKELNYQVNTVGNLDINIKLQYQGMPLVIFEDYTYPDGKKIDFTRVSFYTSELNLDETQINEVEFHNLTNSHSNLALATEGYSWLIENVPTGSYSNLSFNIGVPEISNNKDPGEFPSGHPLAKPAENWFGWMSYIFLKLEGNVDLDDDGIVDTGVALHTGSNPALRKIILDYPIDVTANEKTAITLVFDISKVLDGPTRIFPIEEYTQIHSLSQIDGVLELSDNLLFSFNKQ
jgi:hypothetical protein